MTYEFEGKSEKDAIDKAVEELNLNVEQFDVEILEIQKGGFFKKPTVKIRVHVDDDFSEEQNNKINIQEEKQKQEGTKQKAGPLPDSEIEKCIGFMTGIIERMGYKAEIEVFNNNAKELSIKISGEQAPYIIGKHGKTLDALQLFVNIYLAKIAYPHIRAVVDCENYRRHKEESIIRKAYETADKVTSTKHSILLEPMNPYERRIVHTTLSDVNYIETKSEGNGLYKQVRVLYKG